MRPPLRAQAWNTSSLVRSYSTPCCGQRALTCALHRAVVFADSAADAAIGASNDADSPMAVAAIVFPSVVIGFFCGKIDIRARVGRCARVQDISAEFAVTAHYLLRLHHFAVSAQ